MLENIGNLVVAMAQLNWLAGGNDERMLDFECFPGPYKQGVPYLRATRDRDHSHGLRINKVRLI